MGYNEIVDSQMMERDLDYESHYIGYDEQYPDGGIQCKNHIVCNAVLPTWWFDCKGCYLCTNCDILFGRILKITEPVECPICLEVKKGITLSRCDHSICMNCFKRCYYGDQSGEPSFPYPEIEEKYNEDPENPKWLQDPLIQRYHEEWNAWDDTRMEKYENEMHLRTCPLCRN